MNSYLRNIRAELRKIRQLIDARLCILFMTRRIDRKHVQSAAQLNPANETGITRKQIGCGIVICTLFLGAMTVDSCFKVDPKDKLQEKAQARK